MLASTQLPFPPTHPLIAADELQALTAIGAIHRVRTSVGDEAWLITSYAHVRRLMDGDLLGRAHREPETAARSRASALFGGPIGDFDTEPADHARMRALLLPHFSPKHLRTLQTRVDALTTDLLDDLVRHGSPADLYTNVALPLPILVICELLGVPYADRDRFRSCVEAAASPTDEDRSVLGLVALLEYGMELVTRKRADPGDDVISRLCENHELDDVEVATMSMQLLFAGYETTVTQIWLTALLLLSNASQWSALLADPALIPKAIEESLRAGVRGGFGIPRYASTDFDVDAVTIHAGDLVLLDSGSANHDPAAFPEPGHFDPHRVGTAHVAFGYGSHYCIGASLARMELNTVFGQLIPRFPAMQLAIDPATLVVAFESMADGLTELPVTW